MLAAERRDLLVSRLRRDGKLVARDLAQELGLSEDSVRRDLRELAAAGLCQRVYGGALPASPAVSTHAKRSGLAPESQRRVAARAAELISPGTTVILDGDTTGLAVAAALRPDLAATIVTHSPTTAAALVDHPTVDVFILGGMLHKQSAIACGAATARLPGASPPISTSWCHPECMRKRGLRRRPRRGRDEANPREPGGGHLRRREQREDRDRGPLCHRRAVRDRRRWSPTRRPTIPRSSSSAGSESTSSRSSRPSSRLRLTRSARRKPNKRCARLGSTPTPSRKACTSGSTPRHSSIGRPKRTCQPY